MQVEMIKLGRILVKESEKQQDYEFFVQHLQRLCQNGDAIILDSDSEALEDEIQFKTYDQQQEELQDTKKYGSFDYLREYMDLVIANRLENQMEHISEANLKLVSQQFYQLNKERIFQNYENQLIAKEEDYQKQLTLDKKDKAKKLQKLFS